MMILDTNGLIYCLQNRKPLTDIAVLVTEDLRDEYETALLVNGNRKLDLLDISDLPGYDESFYLQEYARYLNSFKGVAVASMRGLTDASILALVSCVINNFGVAQQTQLGLDDSDDSALTVVTDDDDLAARLLSDFGDKVVLKRYADL